MKRCLIRELVIFNFELGHNATEATKKSDWLKIDATTAILYKCSKKSETLLIL